MEAAREIYGAGPDAANLCPCCLLLRFTAKGCWRGGRCRRLWQAASELLTVLNLLTGMGEEQTPRTPAGDGGHGARAQGSPGFRQVAGQLPSKEKEEKEEEVWATRPLQVFFYADRNVCPAFSRQRKVEQSESSPGGSGRQPGKAQGRGRDGARLPPEQALCRRAVCVFTSWGGKVPAAGASQEQQPDCQGPVTAAPSLPSTGRLIGSGDRPAVCVPHWAAWSLRT